MITLKEIAMMCQVSPSTVSNIMNGKTNVGEKTRERVLKTIQETGYQPNYIAMGLRKQKTRTIGIIVEELAQFTTPGIIEGISEYCESQGYRIVFENLRLYMKWKEKEYTREKEFFSAFSPSLSQLLSIKVDGVLFVAGYARKIPCFPEDMGIPGVMAYAYSGNKQFPSIVLDDEKGGYEMMKYLLSLGHKNIGIVAGGKENLHSIKRLDGVKKALEEEKQSVNKLPVVYGNWNRQIAAEETKYLLKEKVTAIFAFSDRMAGGVYDCLEEAKLKVGKDVSVVGYDNQEISQYFRPKLTTMELPLVEVGRRAAKELIDLMEEVTTIKNAEILLPCSLKKRDSVRKCKR